RSFAAASACRGGSSCRAMRRSGSKSRIRPSSPRGSRDLRSLSKGVHMSAQDRPKREYRSAKHEGRPMSPRQFRIGVVSKDHVDRATAGGFAQVNRGKAGPLERMRAGDGFAFYSPRTSYPDGTPLQAFTAIGRVRTGVVYQAEMEDGFRPFRLD